GKLVGKSSSAIASFAGRASAPGTCVIKLAAPIPTPMTMDRPRLTRPLMRATYREAPAGARLGRRECRTPSLVRAGSASLRRHHLQSRRRDAGGDFGRALLLRAGGVS